MKISCDFSADIPFLTTTALFRSCTAEDIQEIAAYLDFQTLIFQKGTRIIEEGNTVTQIGLVLSGSVQIGHYDFWGNQTILSIIPRGGVFAEAYACIPGERLMIHVIANEACKILFIHVSRLFIPCTACNALPKLMQNLVIISAQKNLQLSRRSLHTSPKTIRERLLSYFSQLIAEQGSLHLVLPFNRQQLADYLNLDRSALSKELGKMKRDGLLDYHKNMVSICPHLSPELGHPYAP